MNWLKVIAGFSYAISFLIAAALFSGYNFGFPAFRLAELFLLLGGLGFGLNLLSYKNDKMGNPLANLAFWLGALLIFIGLVFKMLFWPNALWIMIAGAIVMGISLFIYRKKPTSINDQDVLDQL